MSKLAVVCIFRVKNDFFLWPKVTRILRIFAAHPSWRWKVLILTLALLIPTIGVVVINNSKSDFIIMPHVKIAQIIVSPYAHDKMFYRKELSPTIRGANGFGLFNEW